MPLAQQPVEIDGVIEAGEWEDAAIVRRLFDSGQRNIADEPTEIYLKYDRDAIYLAARCHESQKGYPEAYKRPWDDLFFNNDDGVMFVMGMRDPLVAVQDKIEVGGYDGAMDGHKSKADWYYTFSVNAVGSTQRTFNEMPLERKLFKASFQPYSNGIWTVEIKIPFASCGMKQVVGKKIYANIFRFRPPGLVGWYFPGWGGYRSMPLGTITFLPEARRDELTCESVPIPNLATDLKPHCKATIQYSPLNGTVVGKVEYQGYEEQLFGELNVTGFSVVRKELTETLQLDHNGDPIQAKKQVDYVYCDLVPGSQPERLAEFKVTDSNGKVLARVSQKLKKVTAPEWFGTDAGKAYLSDQFPKPWTDPVVEGGHVHLLDKSLAFASNGLPSSISFNDGRGQLLAADPQIHVVVDGETLDFKPDQFTVVKDKVNVRVQASQKSGKVILSTQNKIEPDGFMVVKFKIDHLPAENIERLMVRIPLQKDKTTFVKHGPLVQKIGQLTGAGYRNEAKNIWVGTYDKGLDFNFDTQVFFSKNKRQQIQIIEEGDINWLVLNFVDGKGQVKEGDIFRFFLQPTPTKPMPEKRIRAWAKWKWERWSRWHGYPDLKPVPELKQWTQELAGKGLIGLLYTCQGLREDAPYFKAFRDDFLLQPHWRYYRDRNVNAYATNKRGPEGDLQLWAWDKLINEAGVRGFVSDGMIPAWGDSNPALRKGAGRKEAVSWDEDMTSSVVAQRQFIKRMCGMLTDTNEPYCVVAHTGGGVDVNTMSFIDGYMEGEQLYRYNRG
ncbi:MAG: glycoside hydrolase domain-containing protein, partial [Phycisphaeraceae bacterium JB051]